MGGAQLLEGGEDGQIAHVIAKSGQRPQRLGPVLLVVLRHQGADHGALVHVDRRPQLALEPSRMHQEAAGRVLAFGKGQHPVLVLGRAPEVQCHGQALGLDVDALGCRGHGLRHHLVDDGGPGVVRRSPQRALQAVEADERDAGWRAEDIGQKTGGTARDHRDQRESGREVGQEGGHPGQWARPDRVHDDGREGPVEIEEQCAAIRLAGQWLQERRQSRRRGLTRGGQRQDAVVVVDEDAARSVPMTTATSTPVVLTGVAAEIGRTRDGCTPIVVAMDAACCCWPGA